MNLTLEKRLARLELVASVHCPWGRVEIAKDGKTYHTIAVNLKKRKAERIGRHLDFKSAYETAKQVAAKEYEQSTNLSAPVDPFLADDGRDVDPNKSAVLDEMIEEQMRVIQGATVDQPLSPRQFSDKQESSHNAVFDPHQTDPRRLSFDERVEKKLKSKKDIK